MRSEDLICAAASASGIDLVGAARTATKPTKSHGTVTRQKFGSTSTVLIEPAKYRARGTASHSTVRPRWTLAELGQASKDVPTIAFQAACYAFAGDDSVYWPLYSALLDRATKMANERLWPKTVRDVHGLDQTYLAHLAITVLDSERQAARFNAFPGLFAVWMRVSDRTWERDLQDRFWMLHAVWNGWTSQAASMIQSKLREQDSVAA